MKQREYTIAINTIEKIVKNEIGGIDKKLSSASVDTWEIVDIKSNDTVTGQGIEDLWDLMETMGNVKIFDLNAKTSVEFIMYYIIKNKKGIFSHEVRDNLNFYSVVFETPEGKKITYKDASKLIPLTYEEIAKIYDGETDCQRLAAAIKSFRDRGHKKDTISSIAYNDMMTKSYSSFRTREAENPKINNADYMKIFTAYIGGFTYLNPLYVGKTLKNITSFDNNSFFGKQMATRPLPVGEPIFYDNVEEVWDFCHMQYDCLIYGLKNLTLKLKNHSKIPIAYFNTENEAERCEGKIIKCYSENTFMTSLDFEMMCEQYEVSCEIYEIIAFNSRVGKYKNYIDFWGNEKQKATQNNDQITRFIAKRMICGGYGKTGQKLLRSAIYTHVADNGDLITDSKIEIGNTYYIPDAVFITAWARYELYNIIKTLKDDFIYCDTDSLKVTEKGKEKLMQQLEINNSKIGAWKIDGEYKNAKFLRLKTYTYQDETGRHYKACGAPEDIKKIMTEENFDRGLEITVEDLHKEGLTGRLLPVRVTGGVIHTEAGYRIKDIENFDVTKKDIAIENFFNIEI